MNKYAIPFLFLTSTLTAACNDADDPGMSTSDGAETDTDGMDSDSGGTSGGSSSDSGGTTGDGSTSGDSDGSTSGGGSSSASGSTSGGTSGGSTGDPADTTPPAVVMSTPGHKDMGVEADATIVVSFSEPMDKAATQAAWQSADLPASEVTFAWNAAGDELTVTPNAPLEYAFGVDLNATDPLQYAFTITTVAADKAGNELEAPYEVTFGTLREIAQELPVTGKLSGYVREDGQVSLNYALVGDSGTQANATYYGYLTFEPTNLPDGIHTLESALLVVSQSSVQGDPYGALGELRLHDMDFGVMMNADTFDLEPGDMIGSFCSDNDELCSISVTDALWADYMADADLSQYRLSFAKSSNFDGSHDGAYFSTMSGKPARIETTYLIE